jgi:hypothetical protein
MEQHDWTSLRRADMETRLRRECWKSIGRAVWRALAIAYARLVRLWRYGWSGLMRT